jgi:epoxyqueuosine reductase
MENIITENLRNYALERGVDLIGFTSAKPVECLRAPQDILMHRTDVYDPCRKTRIRKGVYDPRIELPDARSVVIAGMYMFGIDKIVPSVPGIPRGKIGPWTRDYPKASDFAANVIIEFLTRRGYKAVFSNNLPYRTLAVRARIAHFGKNGFVNTNRFGSYIRLSCVVTEASLATTDAPVVDKDNCGSCRLCIEVCPTRAFKKPHSFDYDRCIHLWLQGQSIYNGKIPRNEREKMKTYLVRGGMCLEVCPKNQNLVPRGSLPYEIEDKPDCPELLPLVLADDEEYIKRLPLTVIKRGITNLRQNVIIALGNIADPASTPTLTRLLENSSASDRLRGLAAWALGKIGDKPSIQALLKARASNTSKEVDEEISAALDEVGVKVRLYGFQSLNVDLI